MDKKTAYTILGLNPGATREKAKINYHKLAKIYHPDLSSNRSDIHMNELKMKEINIAYRFLMPFLKVENDTAPPREDAGIRENKKDTNKTFHHPRESFLTKVIREFKHAFKAGARSNRKRKPHGQTPKTPMSGSENKTSGIHFDDILAKLHVQKEGSQATIRKPAPRVNKHDSRKPYLRYMELRRKMRANKTNQNITPGRVERITPIDPVKPVNKS